MRWRFWAVRARKGNREVGRRLAAEELERREVLSADVVPLPVGPDVGTPTPAPNVELRLAPPSATYGPMFPIRVDLTERLVAPQPVPPAAPAPQLVDHVMAEQPMVGEGEEPGGGTSQQQQTPVIDEYFVWDEPELSRWHFVGHVAYPNPEIFTIYFDMLLEGHTASVNGAGDFIHTYNYQPGLCGFVGATAKAQNGLESNRVEVYAFSA
ncbi:MAG: hypothetical protein KatS3mg110_3930 [Pirellulaceae bacterium]|nr:MAG: hypothetical protein KatS3mg110_3930 [Pirellulaceae bacterium]